MCDILVLSAMSLSSGGFSEVPEDSVKPLRTITQNEIEKGRRLLSKARQEVERARAAEAQAKLVAESAAAERDQARRESKRAQMAETLARDDAKLAAVERDQARQESERAKKAEDKANARAKTATAERDKAQQEAERAKKAEDQANARVKTATAERDKARQEAERAKNAEKQAKADAASAADERDQARQEAEIATAERDQAKQETERAQSAAKQARADAEIFRFREQSARENLSRLQAEMDEIHQRQEALAGNIPQNIAWKMIIRHGISRNKKKVDTVELHSPLVSIDGKNCLFFEQRRLKGSSPKEVVSIVASRGDLQVDGRIFSVSNNLCFVDLGDVSSHPHIGFGVKAIKLNDNIVFHLKTGGCEGPVMGMVEANGGFRCPEKTQNRTFPEKVLHDFSVDEGDILISKGQGSVSAIVGKPTQFGSGFRDCKQLRPIHWSIEGERSDSQSSSPHHTRTNE